MSEKHYCPDCKSELEVISACGSVSYFCNKCNLLISKKRILSEEEVRSKK
jgi:transcription initiation factor TFIIIB Brf1 subunit/transcription initiation factor TFIIB